jgi:hypothetical protein
MSTISTELQQPIRVSEPASGPNLSLQDLQNLLIIVDIATQRGAFKGNELGQIGSVFDRVSQFLQTTVPAPASNDAAEPVAPMAPQPMAPMTPQPMAPMSPPFVPKVGA